MNTLEQERTCLFRDEQAEKKYVADIATQKTNLERAVYEFGELDLKPLQPEELFYFIGGGNDWILNRWKSEIIMPPGLPKNFNREKYLDLLDRPDWSVVVTAASRCNMLRVGLFTLKDGKILINQDIADAYIEQNNVYLQEETEQHIYTKLMQLRRLLYEFDLLRYEENTRQPLPVDLRSTGMTWQPFIENEEQYGFDPRKLKEYIAKFV